MNRMFDLKDIRLTSITFWICALEERKFLLMSEGLTIMTQRPTISKIITGVSVR